MTEPVSHETTKRTPTWMAALLWVLAVILMFAAAIYQRRTGPTYPLRGDLAVGAESVSYRLVRSEETIRDARVILPAPAAEIDARLVYKRYKTDDPFTTLPMERATATEDDREEGPILVASLPAQPAAGKLEYFVEVDTPDGTRTIPETGGARDDAENIIIRFKDPVPLPLLVAHVTFMFFSVLIGMRTGLAALFAPDRVWPWPWVTFAGMTIGGMILGPFVQKYAFGEYWTGFPWGYDLTDNKMLIMWVVWLLACTTLGTARRRLTPVARGTVLVAALVMTAVYLIPHSMRGSELDYSKLDEGVPASEAIGTGD